MKRTLLIILLAMAVQLSFACSCSPWNAFCATTTKLKNDLILTGKVVYSDTLSIKIHVIEIFKGQEAKDTITIWNGTEFDCNGIFPMKANELGSVSDTIVVILPRITTETLENAWDVVGDYRRPTPLCFSPLLHIKGDSILGMINNSGVSYPYWSYKKMLYEDFRQLWTDEQIDCAELVDVQEKSAFSKIDLVVMNRLIKISSNTNEDFNVRLLDIMGNCYNLGNFYGATSIEIKNRKPGVYFLQIRSGDELVRRKIIIN